MLLLVAAIGLMSVLLLSLLQRQLRGVRYARIRREFSASWSRQTYAGRLNAVRRAYGLRVFADVGARQVEDMMFRAIDERWRAMRAAGHFDFVQLREDLAGLTQ